MELLKKLIDVMGPSGFEQKVRQIIHREIKNHVSECWIDKFGNLIAHKKGNGPRIMLAAHMDEIGLMTKKIEKDGKIKFVPIGGIEPISLIGQPVEILTKYGDTLPGIISFKELHEDTGVDKIPEMSDLYVDTGLDSIGLARKGICVGAPMVPEHKAEVLGNKKIISGKALDDRVGCHIMIELAKKLKKAKLDIYYVFTVQEEIGLYGAKTSTYQIDPDWGVAVDTTNSEDYHPLDKDIIIGNGPCLTLMDSEMISNQCLNEWILNLSKKFNIPIQPKVEEHGTTDATNIMLSRRGVPSTVLAVPIRNIHSTVSIAHMDDITGSIKILYQLLKDPPKVCLV